MNTEDFIKAGVYLRAWSPKTVRTYRQAFSSLQTALRETEESNLPSATNGDSPANLTKARLEAWVMWMRQKGLSAGGCNMYIRTVNSYLSWLHEEGHAPQKLRLKLLPDPKKPLRGFSDAELRLLFAFRPKNFLHLRTWTLIQTLLDTGCRIDEVLNVTCRAIFGPAEA